MNDKIKILAAECWAHRKYGPPWFDAEKFAMKIIDTCASMTLDYKTEDHYNGWLDYRDAIRKEFDTTDSIQPKFSEKDFALAASFLGYTLLEYRGYSLPATIRKRDGKVYTWNPVMREDNLKELFERAGELLGAPEIQNLSNKTFDEILEFIKDRTE